MTSAPDMVGLGLDRIIRKLRGHKASLDGMSGNALVGWVLPRNPASGPVEVGVYASGGLVAQGTASLFRPDLKALGIGTGYHGFSIALEPLTMQTIARSGGKVWLRSLNSPSFKIGEYRIPDEDHGVQVLDKEPHLQIPPKRETSDLEKYLFGALQILDGLHRRAREMPAVLGQPALKKHAALFDGSDHLGSLNAPATNLPAPMTIMDKTLDYHDLLLLKSGCDCYGRCCVTDA